MTKEQKKQIEKYKAEFTERAKLNIGYKGNSFGVYKNTLNLEDDNVTIISTYINGFSDNFQPYYETIYLLVQPDGIVVSLMDVFSKYLVADYIKELTVIE